MKYFVFFLLFTFAFGKNEQLKLGYHLECIARGLHVSNSIEAIKNIKPQTNNPQYYIDFQYGRAVACQEYYLRESSNSFNIAMMDIYRLRADYLRLGLRDEGFYDIVQCIDIIALKEQKYKSWGPLSRPTILSWYNKYLEMIREK